MNISTLLANAETSIIESLPCSAYLSCHRLKMVNYSLGGGILNTAVGAGECKH